MKKVAVALVVLSLLTGGELSSAAARAKQKPRVVSLEYTAPGVGMAGPPTTGWCENTVGNCVRVTPQNGENKVLIEVTDGVSSETGFTISQGGVGASARVYCTTTQIPQIIEPGEELTAVVWLVGAAGCEGPATSGTITFTFYKV
jgi:hypothetical protein